MKTETISKAIASLPEEQQREVLDFAAFLKTRDVRLPRRTTVRKHLGKEAFVGMWKDREEMTDSTAWVSALRRNEWDRHG